jgi:hypothetical protein
LLHKAAHLGDTPDAVVSEAIAIARESKRGGTKHSSKPVKNPAFLPFSSVPYRFPHPAPIPSAQSDVSARFTPSHQAACFHSAATASVGHVRAVRIKCPISIEIFPIWVYISSSAEEPLSIQCQIIHNQSQEREIYTDWVWRRRSMRGIWFLSIGESRQTRYHCLPVLFQYLTGGKSRTTRNTGVACQDRGVEQQRSAADRHTPNRCSGDGAPAA